MALVKVSIATTVQSFPAGTPAVDHYDVVIGGDAPVSIKAGESFQKDFADGDTVCTVTNIDVNGAPVGEVVTGTYHQDPVVLPPVDVQVAAGLVFEPVVA